MIDKERDHLELFESESSLSIRSKIEIGIESAIQLIPFGIGSALAVLYFEGKNERRFMRIESFYKSVADDVEALGEQFGEVVRQAAKTSDPERLASLVEELNDRVEAEAIEEKRLYYRRYFENALLTTITEANYEERRLVLDVLSRLTPLQLKIVSQIARDNRWIDPKQIEVEGTRPEIVEGAVGLLKSYGVLEELLRSMTVIEGRGLENQSEVHLSGFGYRLHALCIEEFSPVEPPFEKRPFQHFRLDDPVGTFQSVPYELTDDEVKKWLTASPLRGVSAQEIIEARKQQLFKQPYSTTSIQLKPTIPGRWVVRWRVHEGDAPSLGPELERILADKQPGYIASGEAPFRHTPELALGGRVMRSDTFILTDEEVEEVVRRDFSGSPQARRHYEEKRLFGIQDDEKFSLYFWPSEDIWTVDWHRQDEIPLSLPPHLRFILEEKDPHVKSG